MKIHEYQAKYILSTYQVPTEKNILCRSLEEAVHAYKQLNVPRVVVKAQVLTGGRGKAGGVKLASTSAELEKQVTSILGMTINGWICKQVLVAEAVSIRSEYYVGFLVDRNTRSMVLMLSRSGGMDIEDVSRRSPEKIIRLPLDPTLGMPDFLARRAAYSLFDEADQVKQVVPVFQRLYRLFGDTDASLLEINPLVLTEDGKILAIDAKMTFDDNALYRHPEIQNLADFREEEKKENEAKKEGLSYVRLDGNIGCMVNGAGLAMATMDMIRLYGGKPANFLDIGGSSNPEKIVHAMKLLLSDKQAKVVLINIFGGITRCDDVATGLLEAFRRIHVDIPVVIRLTGTNEKEGRLLLQDTPFFIVDSMEKATEEAINLSLDSYFLKS